MDKSGESEWVISLTSLLVEPKSDDKYGTYEDSYFIKNEYKGYQKGGKNYNPNWDKPNPYYKPDYKKIWNKILYILLVSPERTTETNKYYTSEKIKYFL